MARLVSFEKSADRELMRRVQDGDPDCLQELRGWAASYEAPSFVRDEKNLVKLQSFLGAKLPA